MMAAFENHKISMDLRNADEKIKKVWKIRMKNYLGKVGKHMN
jgi:hypothetical protein